MAKTAKVIDGQKLIGDVETEDVEDAAITAAKMAASLNIADRLTNGTIEVEKLSANLLKYLLNVARVDYGHVGYCKVG